MKCPHSCRVELKKKPNGSYHCPKCGCVFRLVIVRWSPECFAKHNPDYGKVSVKEIREKRRRGRRKKK